MKKEICDEKIDDIYKLACSINKLYHELYSLEINNQKNDDNYNKIIEYLNIALEVENAYYEDNFNDFEECSACFTRIIDEMDKGIESDLDSIINMHYDDAVVRRILGRINRKMAMAPSFAVNNPLPKEKRKYSEQLFTNNLCSLVLCKSDVLHAFLSLLQTFIDKTKNEYYCDKLIHTKYYLSYLNKDVEETLKDNSFSISQKSLQNADYLYSLNNISTKDFYSAKNKYLMQQASRQLLKIIKVSDLEYKRERESLIVIMRLCFLKAFLLQMDNNHLIETQEIYKKIINQMANLSSFSSNNESKKIIYQIFEDIDKDRKDKIVKIKY